MIKSGNFYRNRRKPSQKIYRKLILPRVLLPGMYRKAVPCAKGKSADGKEKMRMEKKKAQVIYEKTVEASFLRRLNRFTAEVLLEDRIETVHVKNTGRLSELLLPKAKVTLQKAEDPERKTAYDLISVYKPKLKWVNVDSLAPNLLMKQYLENLNVYDVIRPEYAYGDSRIDFYMERNGEKYLREVKGCTLQSEIPGIGLFPDAPTERGIKHLKELTRASQEGFICSIDFVIQMTGVHLVYPNMQTSPEFGTALREAAKAGVGVACLSCHVEADRIWVTGISGMDAFFRS